MNQTVLALLLMIPLSSSAAGCRKAEQPAAPPAQISGSSSAQSPIGLTPEQVAFLEEGRAQVKQLRRLADRGIEVAQAEAAAPAPEISAPAAPASSAAPEAPAAAAPADPQPGSLQLPADLQPAPAPSSPAAAPASWKPIGRAWGPAASWQFGLDVGATEDNCAAWAVQHHQGLVGACRDVFLLLHNKQRALHLGGEILGRSGGGPVYGARLGVNVGPAVSAALDKVADKIPALEELTSWKAPVALSYIGKVSSIDYSALLIDGGVDHGPGLKVSIPLADLQSLVWRSSSK